jgi:hypothetical protein
MSRYFSIIGAFLILLGISELVFVFVKQSQMLDVSNQPLGETLKINSATLTAPGFIVIKKKNLNPESNSGKDIVLAPGSILQKGTYKEFWIEVPFDSANNVSDVKISSDDLLVVTLYKDNGDGIFSESNDFPFKNLFRSPVEKEIRLKSP